MKKEDLILRNWNIIWTILAIAISIGSIIGLSYFIFSYITLEQTAYNSITFTRYDGGEMDIFYLFLTGVAYLLNVSGVLWIIYEVWKYLIVGKNDEVSQISKKFVKRGKTSSRRITR